MTERIGFWLDLQDPYVTYENSYIESCWWVMKSLFERDLLFERLQSDHALPALQTPLWLTTRSRKATKTTWTDPSVYPKFPAHKERLLELGILEDDSRNVYVLAWTTTPWTLAANTGLAVKADAQYGLYDAPRTHNGKEVSEARDLYILATALEKHVFGENATLLKTFSGDSLVGLTYDPVLQGRVPAGEDTSTGFPRHRRRDGEPGRRHRYRPLSACLRRLGTR